MSHREGSSAGSAQEEFGEEEQEFETLVEMQLRSHPLGSEWGRNLPQHPKGVNASKNSSGKNAQLLLRERFSVDSNQVSDTHSNPKVSGRNTNNSHYREESQETVFNELRPVGFGDIKSMFQRELGSGLGGSNLIGLQAPKERLIHSHQVTASLVSEDPPHQNLQSWRDLPQKSQPSAVVGEPPLTFGDSARKRHTHRSTEGNLKSSRHDSILKSVTAEAENDVANKIGHVPSMDECIELVQEALEEIYQEKMQEIERSYLVQIEALNKEVQRLHAEKIDSTISPLTEKDYRLGDLEVELKEKYEHMEATLFEKYKRDTEEAVRRVEDEMEQILEGRGLTRARRQQLEFDFVESLEKKYQRRAPTNYELDQTTRLEAEKSIRSKARQSSSTKNGQRLDEELKIAEELKQEKRLLEQEKCEIGRIKSLLAVNMKKVKETQKRLEIKESELDQKLTKLNSLMKHGTKLQRMRAEKIVKSWEDREEYAETLNQHMQGIEVNTEAKNQGLEENAPQDDEADPLTSFEYGSSSQLPPRDVQAQQKQPIQKTKPKSSSHSPNMPESINFVNQEVNSRKAHQIAEGEEANPLASYIKQSASKQEMPSVLNFNPGQNFDNYIQSKLNDLQRARMLREQAMKKEAEMDFEIKKNPRAAASFLIEDQNHRLTLSNLEVPRDQHSSLQSPVQQRIGTDTTAKELNNFLEETMNRLGNRQAYSPLGMSNNTESKIMKGSAQNQKRELSPNSHSVQSRATEQTHSQQSASVRVKFSANVGTNFETSKKQLEFLKPRPASLLTQVFLSGSGPGTALHQQYRRVCEQLIQHAEGWPLLVAQQPTLAALLGLLEECMLGLADAQHLVAEIVSIQYEAQLRDRIAAETDYWQKFKHNHKELLQKLKRREGIRSQIGSLAMEFSGISDIEEFIRVSGSCYTLLRAVDSGLKGMANKGVNYKGIKIDLLLKLDAYEEDFLHKIHAQDIKERYK